MLPGKGRPCHRRAVVATPKCSSCTGRQLIPGGCPTEAQRQKEEEGSEEQTTPTVEQPVLDDQPVGDAILSSMDDETLQHFLDSFERFPPVVAGLDNNDGPPEEATHTGHASSSC
ncbi:uncharacterized protein LOC144753616 [Lissotriton helveticus]